MKTILIPTDFSDNAKHAFSFAVNLFRHQEAVKFLLVNVSDKPLAKAGVTINYTDEIMLNRLQDLETEKLDLVKETGINADDVEVFFNFGGLENVINSLAKQQDINLVVMGTKGASGLKEVFIGSNTNDVFKKVMIPTIAVPNDYPLSNLDSIAFASDLVDIPSAKQLDPLKNLLKETKANLHVVHFYISEHEHDGNREKLLQELTEFSPVYEEFYSEIVGEELVEYVNEKNFNMLAVLMRDRDFYERLFHDSVTEELAFHSEIPLFVIHE